MFIGLLLLASSGAASTCPGDCDDSGDVTIDEILSGVSAALGSRPVDDCPACDTDHSGTVTIDEIISAITAALTGCPPEPTVTSTPTMLVEPTATPTVLAIAPIFPASYRNTYQEVRDCRFSVEHGGVSIRVLANPLAAQPYLNNQDPLPIGSVIVKEEFSGSDCSDDTKLLRWRAMRKEPPGFDSEDGDWHWQWVNRNRSVRFDDKETCIGCHLAPACVARDYMCTLPSEATLPPVRVVFDGLAPALLSAAGTSPTNVLVVGADPQDGSGPYVIHYNGNCWTRLRTGASGSLWWISFKPIGNAFYMAGDGGLILRYDLTSGEFQKQITPGDTQLYGVWGERDDSIWAVGGARDNQNNGGVIWHFDGESWQNVDLSGIFPGGPPQFLKVWGRRDDDIYVVGRLGTIVHYDGQSWSKLASPTSRGLLGVHGNDEVVVATGGFVDGVIIENDGAGFVDRTPSSAPQINGVYVPTSGAAVSVGVNESFALRAANGWTIPRTDLDTRRDFHAVWVDPEGGIWAVGGDLTGDLSNGILVYGGSRTIGSEIDEQGNTCGNAE